MISILKRKIARVTLKATAVLVGGVIVSVAFLMNMDTHSWFTSKIEGNINITTAAAEDILEKIEVEKTNPKEIILKKSEASTTNPMFYFYIEGDIKKYLRHINPIRLKDKDKEYAVPINANVNLYEYMKLLLGRDKKITGKIRIKYLNEFIDETMEIEFTKDYLLNQFYKTMRNDERLDKDNALSSRKSEQLVEIIKYIAKHIAWKEVAIVENAIEIINSNSEDKDEFNVSIKKTELMEEQNDIIEIVAPGLLKYLEKLYTTIEELTLNLNKKTAQISNLEQENKMLNNKIEELEMEKADLEKENKQLNTSMEEMEKENEQLKDNITSLQERMEDAVSDNKKLKRRNSSLSNTNDRLNEENITLQEENERLKQQISELLSEKEDKIVSEDVYGN